MKKLKLLILAIVLSSCNYMVVHIDTAKKLTEEAYFEGQRDALTGDIRIRKNNDSCWIWKKSCWDNGAQPLFNPSVVCGQ